MRLYLKLSWFNTGVGTQKYQACIWYEQCKAMQNIKRDRVERERFKRKYKDMFRGSSHYSTSPPSHRRISIMSTQDLLQRDFYWGITTQHKDYTTHLSTQSPPHKREGTSLAQSKEEIKPGDSKITNSLLMISKNHK